MEEKKHGGSGRNQGRKPVEDKKITLSIYPRQSVIDLLGKEQAKQIALEAIEKEFKRFLKKS